MIHFVAESDKGQHISLFVAEVISYLNTSSKSPEIECIFNEARFIVTASDAVSTAVKRWMDAHDARRQEYERQRGLTEPETIYFGKHPNVVCYRRVG